MFPLAACSGSKTFSLGPVIEPLWILLYPLPENSTAPTSSSTTSPSPSFICLWSPWWGWFCPAWGSVWPLRDSWCSSCRCSTQTWFWRLNRLVFTFVADIRSDNLLHHPLEVALEHFEYGFHHLPEFAQFEAAEIGCDLWVSFELPIIMISKSRQVDSNILKNF